MDNITDANPVAIRQIDFFTVPSIDGFGNRRHRASAADAI
jgi:hypothetical protein